MTTEPRSTPTVPTGSSEVPRVSDGSNGADRRPVQRCLHACANLWNRARLRRSRTVLTVSELNATIRDLLENAVADRVGRGRDLERPGVEYRAHVLHAEGRRIADQGGDVPLGGALPEVQARRRAEGRRAREDQRLRSRRANIRSSASTWSRRASARCSRRSSS